MLLTIFLSEWDTSVVLQFLTNQKITDKKVHESMLLFLYLHQKFAKLIISFDEQNSIENSMTLDDFKRLGVPVGFANSIVKKVAALKEFQAKCLDTNFHEMAIDIMNESMKSEDSVVFPCPSWDENQFSAKQKHAFEFCMHKLDFISKTSIHNNSKSKSTICQNLTFPNRFMYEYLNPRIESYKTETRQGIDHESKMKVTLVITELSEATQHRFVRKFGSITGLTDGMTAIFCCVGATISEIKGTERGNQKLKALAKLCAEWNGTKTVSFCQHFTEAAIEALNMTIEFEHNIDAKTKKYLGKMKQRGAGEHVYKVDKELKKVLLDSNVITTDKDTLQLIQNMRKKIEINSKFYFKLHKELDEFVKFAITVHPLFTSSQDYAFLKGFDRAF
ncbi:hypothetical protein C9374_014344 [Naegleria lovaniensis]|uniref:Uncharacterized protein n=1 Tax=Naegleria lovaniensis TaxID=51637 RepID=A0AA88KPC1_NAELO|nr:uncharacterized protein C9374_014344 [Naegleria lovaniensis]KAG2388944.1 hypothetical protein C9374_014344 [Naegleria lovaniensis]